MLVIANETAASSALLDALRERAADGTDLQVTVIAPVSEPRHGYVVYQDTRRASAGRRLEKTLDASALLGDPGPRLRRRHEPVQAAKDALAQLEPQPDEIIVSTHPEQRSGWLRRDVVARHHEGRRGHPRQARRRRRRRPGRGERNVLVVANETVISKELLDRIRERPRRAPRAS